MSSAPTTDWILVIENQEDMWPLLQRHLRRLMPGVQLVRVINVITALGHLQARLIEQQPLPRLILANLYLPRREEGFHLLTALKSPSSGLSHLPLVMMSPSTDPVDERAVREAGAYFLAKPAELAEWQAFLDRLRPSWIQVYADS